MPFDPYTWLNTLKEQVTKAVSSAPQSTSRFFTMFLAEAPAKWAPMLMTTTPCFMVQHSQRCSAVALSPCLTCGKPVCLDHSLLAADGRLMCHLCVSRAYQVIRKENGLPADEWKDAPQAQAPKKKQEPNLRKKYLDVLDLEDPISLDELKSQLKAMTKRWHPDKATSPEQEKKFTKKMQAVNEAYTWLLAEEEKRKAA